MTDDDKFENRLISRICPSVKLKLSKLQLCRTMLLNYFKRKEKPVSNYDNQFIKGRVPS